MKKKPQHQRKHAKVRALQRYDIDFTRTEHDDLVRRIQNGEGQFVERQSLRISIFKIDVQGRAVKVVYDRQRKTIVTFLPLENRTYAQDKVIHDKNAEDGLASSESSSVAVQDRRRNEEP